MNNEIRFEKYEMRGSDYHYHQVNKLNLRKLNSYTLARYIKHIQLIKECLDSNFNKIEAINLLDVGCGDGVLMFLLVKEISDYKFNLYGVDLSENALKTAKIKMPKGNFSTVELYNTGLEEGFFDLVISSDVIEHVQHPEKMLLEIQRIAKKNAYIIIGTPIRYTENPLDKMHVQEFFQQEFIDLLSKNLKVIELVESHKQLYYLKYIKQSSFFRIRIFRYLYNFQSLFGKNPFMQKINSNRDFPTYMFAICVNQDN